MSKKCNTNRALCASYIIYHKTINPFSAVSSLINYQNAFQLKGNLRQRLRCAPTQSEFLIISISFNRWRQGRMMPNSGLHLALPRSKYDRGNSQTR